MKGQVSGLWQKLRERAVDLARLPLMGLVIFASAMAAWLGIWTLWRCASWIYVTFLSSPWSE